MHGLLAESPRTLGRGDDQGNGTVILERTVEESQWISDHARIAPLFEGYGVAHDGGRIGRGVCSLHHGLHPELLSTSAVDVHVPSGNERHLLSRTGQAKRQMVLLTPLEQGS